MKFIHDFIVYLYFSDNDISTSEPASKDDRINLSIVLSHNTPVADAENSECESSCELHVSRIKTRRQQCQLS